MFVLFSRRPLLLRVESQSAELREDFERKDQGGHERHPSRPKTQHSRTAVSVPTEPDGPVQRAPGHRRRTLSSSHAARHVAHA